MAVTGSICLPGDKSISHRALMMAAWTRGLNRIRNLSDGLDVWATRHCLEACGMSFQTAEKELRVFGQRLKDPDRILDCGNSGTTARLLSGLLAGQRCSAELTGDVSLRRRPMRRITEPLTRMGMRIHSTNDRLPLQLEWGPLKGSEFLLKQASAQVKSCLLLASLGVDDPVTVTEPFISRDHTERFFSLLNVPLNQTGRSLTTAGKFHSADPFSVAIPGDPSTAAFLIAAALLSPKSDLIIQGLSANPTRTGFIDIVRQMGGSAEWVEFDDSTWEPSGTLRIRESSLQGADVPESVIPAVIDEIPVLALLASRAEGETVIRGASELRVKESDRLSATRCNLTALGADIKELSDGLVISGSANWQDAEVDSFGDHRIAMTFEIADMVSNATVKVRNPECIAVSCPEFTQIIRQIFH